MSHAVLSVGYQPRLTAERQGRKHVNLRGKIILTLIGHSDDGPETTADALLDLLRSECLRVLQPAQNTSAQQKLMPDNG